MAAQFKTILEFLDSMEDELGSLTEAGEDMSASHKVHEERCDSDDAVTTNKLNAMNDKVLEIRQLVGVNALSKGLASFKIINEMKRNAIIDKNGFMVPLEDQKPEHQITDDGNENKSTKRGSIMAERSPKPQKSPKKLTAPKLQGWEKREQKRKQSVHAKADDPTHNWKMLGDTLGFAGTKEEGDNMKNGKDSPTSGSDTFDEPVVDRPRAARTKDRTRSVSPRKRTRSPTKKLEEIKRRISTNPIENGDNLIEENIERMDISSPEN